MADLINVLSSQTGIAPEQVQKGVGALLSYLKGNLDPELFGKVEAALPNAPELISAFDSAKDGAGAGSGSGLFGSIASLAGKLFGGQSGETAHFLASLSQVGLSADQIQAFLPKAFELLQAYLPPELVEQIQARLPTFAVPAGPEPDLKSGPA
jgi:hypothetical protein